ncbi:MAG: prephenate dehydrogenase [Akkermansiaceae bacterium]
MNHSFDKITVLGGGLLGGSIALAIGEKADLKLWFRKNQAAENAKIAGFTSATADLEMAVADCELLILAVPVGAMPDLLTRAIHAGLPSAAIVTDVGSVKQNPHLQLDEIIAETGNTFVGSHPMAGSERNGIEASRKDLFEGAACLLTNDSDASEASKNKVEIFWKSLGCRTKWLSAAEHDEIVARISHLPHITAASTILSALENNTEHGQFAGGGLRDTTRVAAGNPSMWAEILTENKDSVIKLLHSNIAHQNEILDSLEQGDLEAVRRWLDAAKELRDKLH